MLHYSPTTDALDAPAPRRIPTLDLMRVRITNATTAEAIALMERWIAAADGVSRSVFIVNAHTLNLAHEDRAYRATLNAADVVLGDGTGVRWGARMQGIRTRDNLVGTDLMPAFFTATSGRRTFLLGGTAGTAARAATYLRETFPGIDVVGCHHGYVAPADDADVVELINRAAPDMLLVAMGNPRQEDWIRRNLAALRVPVSIGVGGLFDHWAGTLRRAPGWVRWLGFEWAQYLLQQPAKWRRYVLGNPKFLARAWADRRATAALTRIDVA